jgi:alkylhydroperoxidase/carboxymuconolactone decarboxylase family protein YurZ
MAAGPQQRGWPAPASAVIDLEAERVTRQREGRSAARPSTSGLSRRERSLADMAALVALYGGEDLATAIRRALACGVTPDEVSETIARLEAHVGWPAMMSASLWAKDVFDELP